MTIYSDKTIAGFMLDFDVSAEKFPQLVTFIQNNLEHYSDYTHKPVGIKEFIEDPDYMDSKGILYPKIMEEIIVLNNGNYIEAVLTGSIGCGKTSIALFTTCYQLYLLSCMIRPHKKFDLDPSSEIIFMFQSINATLAKTVDYMRFKSMIDSSPYFSKHFRYDDEIDSEMRFPNRIIVKPISGSETASLGQNVISAILDEINFMAIIQNSKSNQDGGTYNQAISLYNAMARRRKSRFMHRGKLPGILCLVSSKRYPGQFTDAKVEEQKKEIDLHGKSSIFVYDKRLWDVAPNKFTNTWFKMFIGNETLKPRILAPNDVVDPEHSELVIKIPEEYRSDFEIDPMNALRDIAGISTITTHPFMLHVESIASCFGVLPSILSREDVDFEASQIQVYPDLIEDIKEPRWVHIDLGLTSDSAGIVMGYVKNFKTLHTFGENSEVLPNINIDFILEVKPPRGGEIKFYKIRRLLYKLRDMGINLKWVSLDSWQSTDTVQLLRQKGFITGIQSVDSTTTPYDFLKTALYDQRINAPRHVKCQHELLSLEKKVKEKKIDHPPTGSKDLSDALAGVCYGLHMRREIWLKHGIHLEQIPIHITNLLKDPLKE